ncbi:hypothetical protein [Coraliomargarita parva]|uniref:hypothetical protein n=1 Tax=Coraliomargarita parva TaxID=3014050 RepID=UPI0022B5AD9B|nr:hypothetical protein [Coraliomargarita parva]
MHLYTGPAARTPPEYELAKLNYEDDPRFNNFAGCLQTTLTFLGEASEWSHFETAFSKTPENKFDVIHAARQIRRQGVHFTLAPNELARENSMRTGSYSRIETDPKDFIDGIRWFIGYQHTPVICYSRQQKKSYLLVGYDMIKEYFYYKEDNSSADPKRMSFKQYEQSKPVILGFFRATTEEEIRALNEAQRREQALSLLKKGNFKNMRVLAEQLYREGANVSYLDYNSANTARSKSKTRDYARDKAIERVLISLEKDYLAVLPYYDGKNMHIIVVTGYDKSTHDFKCLCMSTVSRQFVDRQFSKGDLIQSWIGESPRGWHLEVLEVSL